jgi:hypothetical protein
VLTEYLVPLAMKAAGHPAAIAFAPSRFLTDLNYFLAIFAGVFVWWLQRRLGFGRNGLLVAMCFASLVDFGQWENLAQPPENSSPPAGFVAACRWIHDHTSPSAVVLNRDNWTTYLTWRRATFTPIPGSDPIPDHGATWAHLMGIISGEVRPDSEDMTIVKILPEASESEFPVIWEGQGYKVVRVWAAGR